jgi:hypothetical protein
VRVSQLVKTSVFIVLTILLGLVHANADTIRGNVVCREDIQNQARSALANKLRQISGLKDLYFDANGVMRLGTGTDPAGSKTARELLSKAVHGPTVIILEDASRRSDVVFARVVEGRWKQQVARETPVFVVQIDFADFECLIGDAPALKAFNAGWALLHELDHIVENSSDSKSLAATGECEDHINQMRRECNLPERSAYFHSAFPISGDNQFATKLVRLSFLAADGLSEKKKQYWLMWDARVVGVTSGSGLAVLR